MFKDLTYNDNTYNTYDKWQYLWLPLIKLILLINDFTFHGK